MRRFLSRVVDNNGSLVSAASVAVYLAGTSTLATLYSGEAAGETPIVLLANPFKSDHQGVFEFYTQSGDYDIDVTDPVTGFARRFFDVTIQDSRDVNVLKSGDTMVGPLTLSGPPTAALHAATKAYVDNLTSVGVTMLFPGAPNINLAGGTPIKFLGASGGFDLNELNVETPVARPVLFKRLYAVTGGSPGTGQKYDIIVRKNGASTTLLGSISNLGISMSDLVDQVQFNEGDVFSVLCSASVGANNTGSMQLSVLGVVQL